MSCQQIEIILTVLVKELEKFYKKYPGRVGLRLKELQSQLSRRFDINIVGLAIDYGVNTGKLKKSGDLITLAGVSTGLSPNQQKHIDQVEYLYRASGFSPPLVKDVMEKLSLSEKNLKEYLIILRERNILILIEENILIHKESLEEGQYLAIPLPKTEDGRYVAEGGNTIGVSIFKGTKNPDAAWKFAEFLNSAESQSYWNEQVGQIPTNSDVLKEEWIKNSPHIQTAF